MRLTNFFTILTLMTLSTGAFAMGGKPEGGRPGAPTGRTDISGRFMVASNVTSIQTKLIIQDLNYLQSMSIRSADPELLKVLGLAEANSSSLSSWLSDRVQVILGENINLEKSLFPVQENYNYPNAGILPDFSGSQSVRFDLFPSSQSKAVVVMANIGSALYMAGKMNNVLIGLNVPGVGKKTISSPRTGIIQIGEGLFLPLLKKFGLTDKNMGTETYSQFRLATFFHEARHSDGNAKTLGFVHVKCPAGHDFAGTPACDFNLNGPYTVGALVSKALLAGCTNCSAAEKEALKLESLDSFNRVIREKRAAGSSGIDGTTRKVCDDLRDLNRKLTNPIDLPEFCNDPAGNSGSVDVVQATWWDASPEGRR